MTTRTKVKVALAMVWLSGFGWGYMTGAQANAEPFQCDPLTPLYDYKMCYVMQQLERQGNEPPYQFRPQAPPPSHFGGHGSY